MKQIISYNVNGIRAAATKGFWTWLATASPDIICLQETKAQVADLDASFTQPEGYHAYYNSAEKKGYSGVAILTKEKPLHVEYGCGIEKYDFEGRFIRADFADFSVLSVYLPSGTSGEERQAFKEECLADILPYFLSLKQKFPKLVICGDYNIAHTEIDIHNPSSNKNTSGFLPHERAWMTNLFGQGFADGFRICNQDKHQYSWWSYRANARANNKGWRIDYTVVTEDMRARVKAADILADVVHSDHCPIRIEID
jgi:exodeoxyribonuclease III